MRPESEEEKKTPDNKNNNAALIAHGTHSWKEQASKRACMCLCVCARAFAPSPAHVAHGHGKPIWSIDPFLWLLWICCCTLISNYRIARSHRFFYWLKNSFHFFALIRIFLLVRSSYLSFSLALLLFFKYARALMPHFTTFYDCCSWSIGLLIHFQVFIFWNGIVNICPSIADELWNVTHQLIGIANCGFRAVHFSDTSFFFYLKKEWNVFTWFISGRYGHAVWLRSLTPMQNELGWLRIVFWRRKLKSKFFNMHFIMNFSFYHTGDSVTNTPISWMCDFIFVSLLK